MLFFLFDKKSEDFKEHLPDAYSANAAHTCAVECL